MTHLNKAYANLVEEKAMLDRTVKTRKEKVCQLLKDIGSLYQESEEQEAEKKLFGSDMDDWNPEQKALELWSEAEGIEDLLGIIIALKQEKAAIFTECSDVQSELKSMKSQEETEKHRWCGQKQFSQGLLKEHLNLSKVQPCTQGTYM